MAIHSHANGIDSSRVKPTGEARSISRETTFGRDTRDTGLLRATLYHLAEQVGADLRRQGRQARCVTVKLRYADFTTVTRQQSRRCAIERDQGIFDVGCELLMKELNREKQAVRLIGIGVSRLGEGRQSEMLDSSVERRERLNAAIDRVRDKYGFASIETGRTILLKDIL